MADKTREEYESVTRHLRRCIEKTRSPLSLQRLSLDAVATTLWKTTDLDLPIYYEYGEYSFLEQYVIEEKQKKMLDNAKTLIPTSFLTDLDYSLTLKVTQILSANITYHSYGRTEIREYFWTSHGRVNEPEIIRFLIKNDVVHYNYGGDLNAACRFCLEEEVKRLWEPAGRVLVDLHVKHDYEIPWEYQYWMSFVTGQNISPADVERIIHHCIEGGYSTAVEYFWDKLDPEGRDRVFRRWIDEFRENDLSFEGGRDVCFFLVTSATESQLLSLLESKLFLVLCCLVFSTRPEAKLFMSTAIERMSGFINVRERRSIVRRSMDNYEVRPVLFEETVMSLLCNGGAIGWTLEMRTEFYEFVQTLLAKFNRKSRDILMVMFEDATDAEKIEFLISGTSVIRDHVRTDILVVEEFLAKFLLSEDLIRCVKWTLASRTLLLSIECLAVDDSYEQFFDFCNVSNKDMMIWKTAFCNVKSFKFWLPQAKMSATAVDKFLKWCMLSDADTRELRELMAKSDN